MYIHICIYSASEEKSASPDACRKKIEGMYIYRYF